MMKPQTHGGARRNSGRKKSGRKAYLIRMKPEAMAVLLAQAKASDQTVGQLLEEIERAKARKSSLDMLSQEVEKAGLYDVVEDLP